MSDQADQQTDSMASRFTASVGDLNATYRVDFRDVLRMWLQLRPENLAPVYHETVLQRQAAFCVTAYTITSCFSLAFSMLVLSLLPERPSWAVRTWMAIHSFGYLLNTINIFYFRRQRRLNRLNHRQMFLALLPASLVAGIGWGSVPMVVGVENVQLYYLMTSVAFVTMFFGYYWMFGYWLLGHFYVVCTIAAFTYFDITFNPSRQFMTGPCTVMYVVFLELIMFLTCWAVITGYLNQLRVENQNEVIGLLLREFEQGAQDWIWETNEHLEFVYVPDRMNESATWFESSLQDRGIWDLFSDDTPGSQLLHNRMQKRQPFTNIEVCLNNSDPVWWSVSGKPLFDEQQNFIGYRGIGSDISNAREVSDAQTSKRRHDSIVEMAGSIAHDFNNILTASFNWLELIRISAEDNEDVQRYVDFAMESSEQARNITSQLVSFAGQDFGLDPHAFEGRKELEKIVEAVARKSAQSINVQLVPGETLLLFVDRLQFNRAVRNLLENAISAVTVSDGLSADTQAIPEGKITVELLESVDGFARIVVSDNGPGIPPEAVSKIFDPFFTTRRHCGGTGLGLSMVHGFAVQCGGELTAANLPQGGASFVLQLPLGTIAVEPQGRQGTKDYPPVTLRGKTLFLLEDDLTLARGVLELLESNHVRTIHADSIANACAEFDRNGESVDCILSDVMLPDGRGFDFVQHVRRQNPSIPVAYMSGYSDTLPEDVSNAVRGKFLRKPFRLQELVNLLCHELS